MCRGCVLWGWGVAAFSFVWWGCVGLVVVEGVDGESVECGDVVGCVVAECVASGEGVDEFVVVGFGPLVDEFFSCFELVGGDAVVGWVHSGVVDDEVPLGVVGFV